MQMKTKREEWPPNYMRQKRLLNKNSNKSQRLKSGQKYLETFSNRKKIFQSL